MKKQRRSISALLVWTLSYLLVFMIPTAAFIIVYQNMYQSAEAETHTASMLLLEKAKASIDSTLRQMENVGSAVNYNANVLDLLKIKGTLSGEARYKMIETVASLSAYVKGNEAYDQCFLYIPRYDLVISDTSCTPTETFYNAYFQKSSLGYYDFVSLLSRSYQGRFVAVHRDGKAYIAYLKTIPNHIHNADQLNFIILANTRTLEQALSHTSGAAQIIGNDGSPLFTSGDPQLLAHIDSGMLDNADGISAHGDLVVARVQSDIAPMQYVSVVSREVFLASLTSMRTIYMASVAVSFAVSLVIIWALIRFNYMPLKRILTSNGSGAMTRRLQLREYETLHNTLAQYSSDHGEIAALRESLDSGSVRASLNHLLLSENACIPLLRRLNDVHGLSFGRTPVALVLCGLEVSGDTLLEAYQDNPVHTLEAVALSLREAFAGMAEGVLPFHTVIGDDILLFVQAEDPDMEAIRAAAHSVSELLARRMDTAMDAFCSDFGPADSLAQLYAQVVAMRAKTNVEKQRMAFSEEIKEYVSLHYGDRDLSLATISQMLGYSTGYVSRRFKQEQGINLSDHINLHRIEVSKSLMRDSTLSLEQIAKQVGYLSYRTFSRVFSAIERRSPRSYRNEAADEGSLSQ